MITSCAVIYQVQQRRKFVLIYGSIPNKPKTHIQELSRSIQVPGSKHAGRTSRRRVELDDTIRACTCHDRQGGVELDVQCTFLCFFSV